MEGAGHEEVLVLMENSGLCELLGLKEEDDQGMEGEGYLLSPTSCSSAAYSSVSVASTMTQMMLSSNGPGGCGGGGGGGVVKQRFSDSSLSSLCSSPPSTSTITTAGSTFRSTSKKAKMMDGSSRPGAAKVRKEKLGDRITALQQLVSPFGKTDTASVLQEALCYIRFLHDQVQVLSSPYLQGLPSSAKHEVGGGGPRLNDLRSRGLCLVPVTCTEHVARSNGSDYWASAIGSCNDNSFVYKH